MSHQFPDIQGRVTPDLQRLYSDVVKWIDYHNLYRKGLAGGFVSGEDWEFRHGPVLGAGAGLVAVLRTGWQNDFARIFDWQYGGSTHLMKDFEEEVLAPLGMSMGWIKEPTLIGVFKTAKAPKKARKNPCHGRRSRRAY